MPPRLIVEIVGDTSNLERSFKRASQASDRFGRSMNQASRGAIAGTLAFKGLGRSVAFASAAFLGGAGLTAAIRGSINAASNLQEQTARTGVVFGRSSGQIERFSRDALGLARDQALEATAAFGGLFRPLGLTQQASADLSVQLTKLGVDFASFANTPVPEALAAIRSGLVGESEPLRRYQVLLSEARVQQEALAQTGKATAKELTNQEKVLARVALIFRDGALAVGDYERTSDGLANQQRELSKNIRNLQIQLGDLLIPKVLGIVKATNQWLENTENQDKVIEAFDKTLQIFSDTAETTLTVVDRLADGFGRLSAAIDRLPGGRDVSLLDIGRGLRDRFGRPPNGGIPTLTGRELFPTRRSSLDQLEALRTGRTLSLAAFGTAGGATAGQLPPKTRGLDAFIPNAINLELARARTEVQERQALGRQLQAVNKALRGRITIDDRIALEREKTQIIQSLRAMNEAEARERQRGLEDAKRKAEERVEAQKEAMRKLVETVQGRIPGVTGVAGGPLTLGQVNAALSAREQASQFRALGLTAAGEAFAPTGAALRGRADRLRENLKGTIFDTDRNRNMIAQIRKVLRGEFGALTRETKLAIDGLLKAVEDPLKDRGAQGIGFKKLRPRALAERLGIPLQDLSAAQRKSVLQGLAAIGPGGTVPAGRSGAFGGGVHFNGPVTINGINDIGKLEAQVERRKRGRVTTRRGA